MNKLKLKSKNNSIEFLEPLIKAYREGGAASKLEKKNYKELGPLFLKFLWVRDQAHIFHWQTKSNSQHVILGDFYEDYLEELDELAEVIFGQTGHTCSVGDGVLKLMDYSEENLQKYIREITTIFTYEFPMYFPDINENIAIYHILGDLLEVINKFKYLMSQK